MVGDPRDRTAYALAIASLGLALAILLVGICWIEAGRTGATITSDTLTHKCHLETKLGKKSVKCGPTVRKQVAVKTPHNKAEDGVPAALWAALVALGGVIVGILIPFPFPAWASGGLPEERIPSLIVASIVLLFGVLLAVDSPLSLTRLSAGCLLLGLLVPSPARGE